MAIENRPERFRWPSASAGTTKKWVAVRSSPAQRATFRDVLAVREFRTLWLSQILSAGGDPLAPVAPAALLSDPAPPPLPPPLAPPAGTLASPLGAPFLPGVPRRLPPPAGTGTRSA